MSISENPRADVALAAAHLAACMAPAPGADPIQAMRDGVDRYGDIEPRPPLDGVVITPAANPDIVAEWVIAPGADAASRLVYLHGGGWIAGGLYSHRPITAYLARRTGCAVLAVDYRLAPEHPFPAGLDDSVAAIDWAADNGPKGPGPAARLLLAGDSAGGNLAAAACLRLIAADARVPDRLALLSAVLDVSPGAADGEADAQVGADGIALMMTMYAPQVVALDAPDLSPARAPAAMLDRFPPTLLQASAHEYLLGDAQRFMTRLTAAGNRAVLSVWPDMPHVWHAFFSLLPEAPGALDEVAEFLRSGP